MITSGQSGAGRAAAVYSVLAVLALWIGATAAVIVNDAFPASRAAQDQDNYHLRAVRTFASELPNADLRNYRSATTPGYHLALAEFCRYISGDARALRAFGALFTLALLLLPGVIAIRSGTGAAAGAVLLPLGASLYVFSAGAWILPDNAAWLGVLAIVALALVRRPTPAAIFAAGGILLLLVLCRQIHLWGAGVVWVWAVLGGPGETPDLRTRAGRLGMAFLASVPAFAAVGAFWNLWGGLVPPLFQGGVFDPVVGKLSPQNQGGNPATPAFLLMLFGAYGVFFLGFLTRGISRVRRAQSGAVGAVALGMVAGLALALIPETTFSVEAGRYTGFWALVPKLPVVAGRSLFLAGGAAVGGAIVGLCFASLTRRDGLIVLATVAAFCAAQSTAFAAWQRYMEPMVLIVLAMVSIMSPRARDDAEGPAVPAILGRIAPAGPVLLGLMLGAITLSSLRQGAP